MNISRATDYQNSICIICHNHFIKAVLYGLKIYFPFLKDTVSGIDCSKEICYRRLGSLYLNSTVTVFSVLWISKMPTVGHPPCPHVTVLQYKIAVFLALWKFFRRCTTSVQLTERERDFVMTASPPIDRPLGSPCRSRINITNWKKNSKGCW